MEGQEAINLWLQGRDAWNQWVEKYPEADIDFSGVDFGRHRLQINRKIPFDAWPFAGFQFPSGKVSFHKAKFGEKEVNFGEAGFGRGDVDFSQAQFGKGNVSFTRVHMGKGNVDFSYVQFEGDVFFGGQFGREVAYFTANSSVEEPLSQLNGAHFGEGDVLFRYARIKGDFYLTGVTLGSGKYNFEGCDFERRAIFAALQNVKHVESFSFRYASFGKPLILSAVNNEPFGCVVDLTDTRINSHVSLQGLACTPRIEKPSLPDEGWRYRLLQIFPEGSCQVMQELQTWVAKHQAAESADEERLYRLKELAETHRDHGRALEFKAQEMQAKRWHKTKAWDLILEFGFQLFSNYGCSELRPLFGLVVVWLFFGLLYSVLSAWCYQSSVAFYEKLGSGFAFSVSQMLPLIPGFRESRESALQALFGVPLYLPWGFSLLTFFQSLLAIIFLFLLGLALRNRFRL